jgi:hypothetical protein
MLEFPGINWISLCIGLISLTAMMLLKLILPTLEDYKSSNQEVIFRKSVLAGSLLELQVILCTLSRIKSNTV